MANIIVKDGLGVTKYLKAEGVGDNTDPFTPEQDVNMKNNTSPLVILPLVQQLGLNTLAAEAVPESYTVLVTSSAGMSVGDHFRIINSSADYFYFGKILGIAANTLTLDTPVDFAYLSGSEVTYSNINMAVDGSVTPVHFHLRTGSPSIPSSVDVTRIIMVCETLTAVDLSLFGDLPALTRGIVLRESNGSLNNLFNVKANKDLAALGYDLDTYVKTNPAQGVDGFAWRLTFGGASKMGSVIRILQDGQLGMIVQDDLTGLTSLTVTIEGHVVNI